MVLNKAVSDSNKVRFSLLGLRMESSETSLGLPVVDVSQEESIGVWVVHVVVDTSCLLESSWLPKLGLPVGVVVEIENVLRHNSNDIQASEVGLTSRIEASKVREVVEVSFELPDFKGGVVTTVIWVDSGWQRSHGMQSSSNSIKWHADSHSSSDSYSS